MLLVELAARLSGRLLLAENSFPLVLRPRNEKRFGPKRPAVKGMMKIAVCRKAHFNAAHRLHNPAWSAAKNQQIFGKCNNPNYHGHNYELIVKIIGPIDPETGYLMDLKTLKDLIDEHIIERFDHKNLNLDTLEFQHLNPTAENIAVVVWHILRPYLAPDLQLVIQLYETERNFVEYPAI